MKDVITRNDSNNYQIVMAPEDAIDVAIVEAMATRVANNPASLSFTYKDGTAVISVTKKL